MKIAKVFESDFSLPEIEAATTLNAQRVVGQFKQLALHSHYQPILSLAHRRVVGYEALVRPHDAAGQSVSPLALFKSVHDDRETVYLDRLCRNIHVRNFMSAAIGNTWLFLNVNPIIALNGKQFAPYFSELLSRYQLPASHVVVEILENAIADEVQLADTVAYYKELGCLVAIDYFGAGHSNFERIWRIKPQIVKLDRSMIVQARLDASVRRVLPGLVALLHEAGALTLMEGIETEEEALIAMDTGIDFVQGFLFGHPAATLQADLPCTSPIANMCMQYREQANANVTAEQARLKPYQIAFRQSASLASLGYSLDAAAEPFLRLPGTVRCFLLNKSGYQVGDNIVSQASTHPLDPRYRPLADVTEANWSRRPYYRRALHDAGNIQVSRPYLSVSDARMCITLSVTVERDGAVHVFCADLLSDEF